MVVFRSIRSKIIVGIVSLLVITSMAITLVATQRTKAALTDQIEETHEAHAERVAQTLDRRIFDALAFAEAAGRNDLFRQPVPPDERATNGSVPPGGARAHRAFLDQLVATVDLYGSATVLDEEGRVVLAEPIDAQWRLAEETPAEGGVSRLRVLARLASELDDSFVQRGLKPGTWVAVVPLYTHENRFHGALLFEGRNAPLVAFVEEAVAEPATAVLIVDDQGRVIAGPGPFVSGYDLAREIRQLDERRGSEVITLSGADYLASAHPLAATGWRLVLATDTQHAFGAVDTILRTTILLGGIALVFGVAMSLVLAQDISVPIRRLKQASERVTAGEYGTQVRVATRDELSDLAGAFNAMSARLHEENQRLLQYQESLEETVDERTRALSEKNDELEAFVYAASHDLRTPLISLDWLVQELEDALGQGVHEDPQIAENLGRIRANIDGMDRLIADLLELSRIGRTEGEPSPVPVGEVVGEVLESLHPRISERGVQVEVDIPHEAVVLADRRRLQQVFSNLLGNAIKYGRDDGGRVQVRTAPIGAPERPWKWRIEIADNGPGIPPEHRERIFMLFQRAPDPLGRPIEGTGVGLAMVRKIVHAYGGQVHASEAPGGGALFWLTLPAPRRGSERPPNAGVPQDSSAPEPTPRPEGLPSNLDKQAAKYRDDPLPAKERPPRDTRSAPSPLEEPPR